MYPKPAASAAPSSTSNRSDDTSDESQSLDDSPEPVPNGPRSDIQPVAARPRRITMLGNLQQRRNFGKHTTNVPVLHDSDKPTLQRARGAATSVQDSIEQPTENHIELLESKYFRTAPRMAVTSGRDSPRNSDRRLVGRPIEDPIGERGTHEGQQRKQIAAERHETEHDSTTVNVGSTAYRIHSPKPGLSATQLHAKLPTSPKSPSTGRTAPLLPIDRRPMDRNKTPLPGSDIPAAVAPDEPSPFKFDELKLTLDEVCQMPAEYRAGVIAKLMHRRRAFKEQQALVAAQAFGLGSQVALSDTEGTSIIERPIAAIPHAPVSNPDHSDSRASDRSTDTRKEAARTRLRAQVAGEIAVAHPVTKRGRDDSDDEERGEVRRVRHKGSLSYILG